MMHQTFGNKVSRLDQLMRVSRAKQVGRKHNHTLGPGKAAAKAARRNYVERQRQDKVWGRFADAVRAYWRGERETYPDKP
jgi:hypothetical protein